MKYELSWSICLFFAAQDKLPSNCWIHGMECMKSIMSGISPSINSLEEYVVNNWNCAFTFQWFYLSFHSCFLFRGSAVIHLHWSTTMESTSTERLSILQSLPPSYTTSSMKPIWRRCFKIFFVYMYALFKRTIVTSVFTQNCQNYVLVKVWKMALNKKISCPANFDEWELYITMFTIIVSPMKLYLWVK